ncbi:unnamed protein product [Coffea canephora]|uniref:Uncharacterized protein n=1 Tax=Coffea canephora TaxID=49390 RepID=A0A068UF06_COFCA|nr:unnamed protein product [Coffea canephora]
MVITCISCSRLEDRVGLVTGAASGIGKSAAGLSAKHGAEVDIADIRGDLADKSMPRFGSFFNFIYSL